MSVRAILASPPCPTALLAGEGSKRPPLGGGSGDDRVASFPGEAVHTAIPDLIRDLDPGPVRSRCGGQGSGGTR